MVSWYIWTKDENGRLKQCISTVYAETAKEALKLWLSTARSFLSDAKKIKPKWDVEFGQKIVVEWKD